jgi:uncharacterized protein (TIGR03435 family)
VTARQPRSSVCRRVVATGVLLWTLTAASGLESVRAQTPAASGAATPSFEVASVKPNTSGQPFIRFGLLPGGRFNAENVPLRQLIVFAYAPLQSFQIEGGPAWIGADRFDVTAKAEGEIPRTVPGTVGPVQLMMRSLLAERFKLVTHSDTKEQPIYNLVVARSDGRLGARIEPSKTDCAAQAAARGRGIGPGGTPGLPPGPPPGPPPPGQRPECGLMMGFGNLAAGGMAISNLAQTLSQRVNRVVVDKTGLTGRYDFSMEFTPDQMPPPSAQLNGAPFPAINPDGPSLFTALQEQLGLKLESARGAVEMLVIDSVEQPSPD